jgi:hypothetical protein
LIVDPPGLDVPLLVPVLAAAPFVDPPSPYQIYAPISVTPAIMVKDACGLIVEVDDPTIRMVWELMVSRAIMVVELPEPMVIECPGSRVWPETMKSEAEAEPDASSSVMPPRTKGDVLRDGAV